MDLVNTSTMNFVQCLRIGSKEGCVRIPIILNLVTVSLLATPLPGQDRPAAALEAERAAKELFNAGDYDKAVPVLQDALANYPGDLKLMATLGMAYLYSSSRIDLSANFPKAKDALDRVLQAGGEVTFLVAKAEDPAKRLSKFVVKATPGELHMSKTAISFTPSRGAAGTVLLQVGSIKECGLNRGYGKDSNTFHLKADKETVNLRPLHFSADESNLICSLASKYLGVKTANGDQK
jgi:hypothetical protein